MIIILLYGIYGPPKTVTSVEYFAGCASISRGVVSQGGSAVAMDFSSVSGFDDINTPKGFIKCMIYAMGLEPNGFLFAAPPCSSWIWISRGSSQRSEKQPLGNTGHEKVRGANEQVARVLLLIITVLVLHNGSEGIEILMA